MPYRPKLDPERDLQGATPETLAKALFRRVEPYQDKTASSSAKRRKTRESSATSSRTSDAVSMTDKDSE